jgi:hypothetical protein
LREKPVRSKKPMPKGPHGQKRPGDVIGAAIMVAKIATGEIDEAQSAENDDKDPIAVALGKRGGKARAAAMNPEQRKEIARIAAAIRWKK